MSARDYISTGDRVIVTGNAKFGSSDLTDHQGKHGVVEHEDGWGKCTVLLDDGTRVVAWNGADLSWETHQAPSPLTLGASATGHNRKDG